LKGRDFKPRSQAPSFCHPERGLDFAQRREVQPQSKDPYMLQRNGDVWRILTRILLSRAVSPPLQLSRTFTFYPKTSCEIGSPVR